MAHAASGARRMASPFKGLKGIAASFSACRASCRNGPPGTDVAANQKFLIAESSKCRFSRAVSHANLDPRQNIQQPLETT
jgi:hypothetical protein